MFVCELCDRHPIQHETELTPSMSLSSPWPLLGPTVSRIPTLSNQPSQCAQAIRDKTWLWYFVCTVISVLKTNDICLISVVFYVPTPLYIYMCVRVPHSATIADHLRCHSLPCLYVCVCVSFARPPSKSASKLNLECVSDCSSLATNHLFIFVFAHSISLLNSSLLVCVFCLLPLQHFMLQNCFVLLPFSCDLHTNNCENF